MAHSDPYKTAGFTLVEAMIVVAVMAILASIAYPSYQAHVRKSRRAAAQSFLMDVATRQQQRFVDIRSYAASLADLGMVASTDVQNRYSITVELVNGPPPTYTLKAQPINGQAMDSCGLLSVTNTGARSPANCW